MWAGPTRDWGLLPAVISIDNLEVLQAVVYYCSLENSGSQVASCMHNERYSYTLASSPGSMGGGKGEPGTD